MSNRPTTQAYDDVDRAEDYLPRQHAVVRATMTLTGTHAAAGTHILDLFRVPANSAIKVSGATVKRTTGGTGTATAPNWGLGYSLAGTGTVSIFGTILYGTVADNEYQNFSVTETTLAAGDVIRLHALTGTQAGASSVADMITLEYKEDWT